MKRTTRSQSHAVSFEELPDWMTVRDAQIFLRLGRSTIYEMIQAGEIPSRRFGRQFRIAKEALRPTASKSTRFEV